MPGRPPRSADLTAVSQMSLADFFFFLGSSLALGLPSESDATESVASGSARAPADVDAAAAAAAAPRAGLIASMRLVLAPWVARVVNRALEAAARGAADRAPKLLLLLLDSSDIWRLLLTTRAPALLPPSMN